MDIDELRTYCLSKKAVKECFPFDEETLVFKVGEKMFCLTNLNLPFTMNLKCDPEKAVELREEYDEILPGYHMSKVHWNTVSLEGSLTDQFLKELIDHSYDLVIEKMSKKDRKFYNIDN